MMTRPNAYEIPSEAIALHFARAFALLENAMRPLCPACQQAARDCRCSHWCAECGCTTNHTTAQHEAAAAEGRQEP